MIDYIPTNWENNKSIIKVIGVGGGGGNAVNQMFEQGIQDVEFMICNTDTTALKNSPVMEKIQLGHNLSMGLGAGCDPEKGRNAALESIDAIRESLSGHTQMIFITAGMGGGTGTGASPVIAKLAKEMDILTVGVVTLPFRDEGQELLNRAIAGIEELQNYVDSLLIIDNQKIYKTFGELNIFDAFQKSNVALNSAVKGIAEIITRPGFINVDFADVKMIMKEGGMALLGTGTASGEDRAVKAVVEAFTSPLLNDYDLKTAKGVLVNITSSNNNGLTMSELSQIMDHITEYTGDNVQKFKRGVVNDPDIGDSISVTVVATGFNMQSLPNIARTDSEIKTFTLGTGVDSPAINEMDHHIPHNITATTVHTPIHTPSPSGMVHNKIAPDTTSKPALILTPEDDITQLERQPAYIRRKMALKKEDKLGELNGSEPRGQSSLKIEERDGKQHLLSDNSFLHQKQD